MGYVTWPGGRGGHFLCSWLKRCSAVGDKTLSRHLLSSEFSNPGEKIELLRGPVRILLRPECCGAMQHTLRSEGPREPARLHNNLVVNYLIMTL